MRVSPTSKQPPQGRWTAVLLVAVLTLLAAPTCAPAAPAPRDSGRNGSALETLGDALLAALGSSRAGDAVDTLGNSLALLGARYRIESGGAVSAGGSGSAGERAPERPLTAARIGPGNLPPASAGSNGSHVPHASSLNGGDVFAHTRAGDESSAILLSGVALAPPDAPAAVKNVINNANMIVGRPYVWGGGHASWYSNGYDCSGSVSFALFGGGLIPRPLTSSELEGWGEPGPGRWITVYANAGHTFAEIAGLRWDTVGDAQGTGPRWHLATTDTSGFVARHPPGL
ncbi:MAG: hypothetical protein ACM3NV_01115 [Syntrophothermus sp.]